MATLLVQAPTAAALERTPAVKLYAVVDQKPYEVTRNEDGSWTSFTPVDLGACGNQVTKLSPAPYYYKSQLVGTVAAGRPCWVEHDADGTNKTLDTSTLDTIDAVTNENGSPHAFAQNPLRDYRWGSLTQPAGVDFQNQLGATVSMAASGSQYGAQVLAVTASGGLFHATRTNSNYSRLGDVKTVAGDPGPIAQVAAEEVNGALEVVVRTTGGRLFHTTRYDVDGRWDPFRDLTVPAGNPGPAVSIAVAAADGPMQLVVETADHKLWHTIRWGNTWQQFGDVGSVAPLPAGTLTTFAVAGVDWP